MSFEPAWREQIRASIRRKIRAQKLVPPDQVEAETARRFEHLMQMDVPSDAKLKAMQQRGELPADDALARDYP